MVSLKYMLIDVTNALREYVDDIIVISSDCDVLKFAKTLKISSSYLERIFKNEYNQSIIEYIINQRLNYAIILLKSTSLSYKTIAERSGFKTYVQLYKTFKTKLGCTIDEFKQTSY